ncbi:hypothetical protein EON66_03680, partial [archaeon]
MHAYSCRRLAHIPLPPMVMMEGSHSVATDEPDALAQLLEADASTLPSEWCRSLHAQLRTAVMRLHSLILVMNEPEASASIASAVDWLSRVTGAEGMRPESPLRNFADPPQLMGEHFGGAHGALSPRNHLASPSGVMPALHTAQCSKLSAVGSDAELEATINTLVSTNEWSVRVHATAGAGGGSSEPDAAHPP